MPFVIIEDAHGKRVRVEVSEAVAVYIAEDDRYIASLHDNDQRYFQLIHFDKRAWENMQDLSTGFSAEDEYLGVPEETAAEEWIDYQCRLALCRHLLPQVREACTPTQWRRLIRHELHGLTFREIARLEGANDKSIVESVHAARKKIKNILLKMGMIF